MKLLVDFKRWRPLIVQTFLPFGDTIGRVVAHIAGVPILISSIRARNIDKSRWQFLLDRTTIRWVDRVIFNSQEVVPFAVAQEGVHSEQVVYIPNGVNVEGFQRSLPASDVRVKLGIPTTSKVIGTIGRLVPQKGHRFLLPAFAQVLQQVPEAYLLIVGDGPLASQLLAEAKRLDMADRIRFLGRRLDIPDLLACMAVYVHASIFEGMPNAVMEAMAAGKPVVATAVDGTKELITDGKTGWLVEPSDPQAMAERLTYALNNVAEAQRIGASAAQHMAQNFSLEHMVAAYDRLYRELVAQAKGTAVSTSAHV
jgi:glycosyltransferase involved in cell wall biosynthesis